MSARLEILTLGGVRIQRGDEPVTGLSTKKAEALLIYLAASQRAQPREVLAEQLWDERSQSQAMGNLRGVLTNLRQELGNYLIITRDTVGINPEAEVWLDAAKLENCLADVRKQGQLSSTTAKSLVTTLELYQGEFLQGFSVFDCRGFEDWVTRERERIHHLVVDAYSSLVDYETDQKQYQQGMAYASRLLELDPLNESAHRQMMQLLEASGQRTAALNQYETCQKLLHDELGVEPEAETRRLYNQLRVGEPGARVQPPSLPRETVTFLFTDIEGSTQLLARLKDKYATLLDDHQRILREAFAHWEGHEVDTQGDAFFVAFGRATQAVGAAAEAQRKLSENNWPERVTVRVRMGIHTGEPLSGVEGYVGIDVHRAARIAHVASGGQVLLSETTTALVQDELPQGVTLADLGRHLLKDIYRPEHIHQLVIEGHQSEFPSLTSLEMLPPESARQKLKVGSCPYRGLSAFQEADTQFYYGRETFIDALEQAVTAKKLVAVILGSSGSGKSSAIFAGLLPRLRKVGGYQIATFRPGTQPFYSLSDAVIELLEPNLSKMDHLSETGKLAEQLAHSKEVHLAQVLERICKDSPSTSQVLLVIDQFEELYTLCSDEGLQKAFIDELLATVEASKSQRTGRAVILLTMRADFMGQALLHRPFADALQEATILMGPMNRQELHTAIEKPAEMQGAAFEPGLVERILNDVGEKPGNLPLLEFTLTQLWERQTDGWLTHTDYEAMGCVEGALAAYADEVFTDLEPAEQARARHAFVQLVQPGEGTADTRRIATHEELGDEAWGLIQHLADKRLVVTGRDALGRETVEVVHEALIQKWGRFQDWMNADRAFRLWQERLRLNLRQWQESGHDEGTLLAGAPLAVALGWLADRAGELSPVESSYIQASQVLQVKQQKERRRKRQWTFAGLSIGLVIALVLAAVAVVFGQQANENAARASQNQATAQSASVLALNEADARGTQQAIAEAERANAIQEANSRATAEANALQQAELAGTRELSLAAINNLDKDPELSILLALEAVSKVKSVGDTVPYEVQDALHRAVLGSRLRFTLRGHTDGVWALSFSPDGSRLATGSFAAEGGKIWDMASGQLLQTLQYTDTYRILYSPGGSQLASGSRAGNINLWSADTGERLANLVGHTDIVWDITYSPDGKRLASIALDATVRVWDTKTGEQLIVLPASMDNWVNPSVAFSPDGKRLMAAATTVQVWDTDTWTRLEDFEGVAGAFSPDGKYLAIGGMDGSLRLVDADSGMEHLRMIGNAPEPIYGIDYSPTGKHLSGHAYSTTIVWDSETGVPLFRVTGALYIETLFTPDGSRLVTTSQTGIARVWDVMTGIELFSMTGMGAIYNLALSPSCNNRINECGALLATGSRDNTARIWDISAEGSSELLAIRGFSGKFSSDGKHFISTSFEVDDYVRLIFQAWSMTPAELGTVEASQTFTMPSYVLYVNVNDDLTQAAWLTEAGAITGTMTIADLANSTPIATYQVSPVSTSRSYKTILDLTPDWAELATAGGNSIQILDASSGQRLIDPIEFPNTVLYLRYSTEGKYLAVAEGNELGDGSVAGDTTIHLLDGETYQEINSWVNRSTFGWVYDLSFNANSTQLISAGMDMKARIWEIPSGKLLTTLSGHAASIITAIFNKEGTKVATLGLDNVAKVWDAASGQNLLSLSTVEAWPHFLSFSPNGKYLAFADAATGSIKFYILDIDELADLARSRLTRGLTPEECQAYLHTDTCPPSP